MAVAPILAFFPDVAVEDVPALRPWLRELLRTRLQVGAATSDTRPVVAPRKQLLTPLLPSFAQPLLAQCFPLLADGTTPSCVPPAAASVAPAGPAPPASPAPPAAAPAAAAPAAAPAAAEGCCAGQRLRLHDAFIVRYDQDQGSLSLPA